MMSFAEYETEKWKWITAFDKKYYPDHFEQARSYYQRHINRFRELANRSADSVALYRAIMAARNPDRTQMLRIFTRYVSPKTSVEMLQRVGNVESIIAAWQAEFRDIGLVREWANRRKYDGMLAVVLWEYKDRGKVGYDLTEEFFDWFENRFPAPEWKAVGKRRGGSQGSDRIGGNKAKVLDILNFENEAGQPLKILFVNDGPGLGIGELWERYGKFELINPERILVCTLKMLPSRLTRQWILGTG